MAGITSLKFVGAEKLHVTAQEAARKAEAAIEASGQKSAAVEVGKQMLK